MRSNNHLPEDVEKGFSALSEVCKVLASGSSDRELTSGILEVIRQTFGGEVCTLRLLDESTGELVLAASLGLSDYSKPVRLGESIIGKAVQERRPYAVPDISNSPYKNSEFAKKHGLRSLLSVPLILRDRAVGGVTVYSRTPDNFRAPDVRLLCSIATQLAAVLENMQLIRDTVSTLVSLARAVEAKDPYTQGHSERVTLYAVRLAEQIGLPPQDLAILKLVGPVHDIGKIGISESILNKPARLSPQERRIMEKHPVIGETIVNTIRSFKPGLPIVRNHHERFDGTGYPDRLKGEQLPLTARIVSIADAYDAMTTKRPYRDPMEPSAAFEELESCAGTQFDGDLVRVFCKLGREGLLGAD